MLDDEKNTKVWIEDKVLHVYSVLLSLEMYVYSVLLSLEKIMVALVFLRI